MPTDTCTHKHTSLQSSLIFFIISHSIWKIASLVWDSLIIYFTKCNMINMMNPSNSSHMVLGWVCQFVECVGTVEVCVYVCARRWLFEIQAWKIKLCLFLKNESKLQTHIWLFRLSAPMFWPVSVPACVHLSTSSLWKAVWERPTVDGWGFTRYLC